MALYTLFIFLSALWGMPITLSSIWVALSMLSAVQLIFLMGGVVKLYGTLKESVTNPHIYEHQLAKRIVTTRFFSWANQCIQQLFSGNFLVPLCALHFGLESASLMKVITSISYWITLIAQKVFGVTGNALLAHVKTRSAMTQRTAFDYISFLLTQALYSMLIFLIFNGKKIALAQAAASGEFSWALLYVMCLISFFESFFILFEKWYILEERIGTFFLFNGICFALIYALYPFTRSLVALFMLIISLRLVTLCALTMVAFKKWRIWPSFRPDPGIIAAALLISAFFYWLV